VHRTFQEYLAAKALIAADHVGEVIRNAADDQWREVVVLPRARATPGRRPTCCAACSSRHSGQAAIPARLLAVASLDEIHGVEREVMDAVYRSIQDLIPPRSLDQAEALSHAGERLLPLLASELSSVRFG